MTTLNDLIEMLTDLRDSDPDRLGQMQVMMSANYGDRGNTLQALRVESVEEKSLYETAYSHSGLAVAMEAEDEERSKTTTIVIL